VNCEVCGTELPHGALFCGECGRAVGTRSAKTLHPDSGMPVEAPESAASELQPSNSSDTAIIEPLTRTLLPELESELADSAESEAIEQDLPPEVIEAELAAARVTGAVATHGGDEPEPDDSNTDDIAEPETDDSEAREPEAIEPEIEEQEAPEVHVPEVRVPTVIMPPRPDPFPWGDRGAAVFSDSDELEQTLIVPRRETGERFILQFSTGESVTVFGSGLLGRNPSPQPTEYFDQLVSISDPGKSVSKTHLEFGQEAGSFWVSDRFSGNGSAVREPETSPRRLVAGKRYRIVRGTRVDIGEQFFVVS
jgi:hypothetical protein